MLDVTREEFVTCDPWSRLIRQRPPECRNKSSIEHKAKGKVTNHLFLKKRQDEMTWGITKGSRKTIKNTIPPEQAVKSNFIDIKDIKGTFMFAKKCVCGSLH